MQISINKLMMVAGTHGRDIMDSSKSARKWRKWEEDLNILQEATKPPLYNIRGNG